MIGVFLNTLVLRSDLSGDPTVVDLLKRVKTTALEAYRYQNVPFEQVDALNPAREMSHSRLFQVMFILQNTPGTLTGEAMTMPSGLSIRQLDLERGVSPFDITLSMDTMDGQLVGKWEYNRDLFNESTIQQMTGHFQQLLESMVNAPEKPISQLSMLTSAERSRLLPPQQTYSTPHLNAGCIHTLFEQQVAQTPDAIAVEHPSGSLTYAALNQLANQLAHHLASLGIEPDGLVGLCVARSPQMLIGVLGILKAGAAYVPLDPHYPQARLDYMVKDANIAVVVTTNSAASNLSLPASIQQIRLDTAWDSVISQQPTINPTQPVKANHLAYVIYTSGSTGQPKGVLIEHRSLVSFAQGAIQAYGFTAEDKVLQFASLNFDTAAEEIYPCLLSGGTLVLRTESAAGGLAALGEVCQQWQLTVLDLPTAYWQQLVAEATKQKQAKQDQAEQNQSEQDPNNFLTNLRLVIIGGEKVAVESVAQWQQLMATRPNAPRLLNTYGPTETTVVATLYEIPNQPEAERLGQEIAIGKPLPNVDVYVLDNRQRLVPVGVPGELYIGGPGVARGYLNRPEQTAKAFVASPFDDDRLTRLYKTGDRVRYLPDGNLEYLGRFDHQVKIRGFRIELGEIETALAQQPGIQQSLVMVREDNPGHPQIVAYAVLAESATVNQAVDQKANQKAKRNDLRTALKRRLPDYMVPSVFMFLEEFPLTPNGKVDRHSLPVPDQADLRQDQEYVAPRTETEAELVQIVQDVLGLEKVGVEDNFFEIGGHSLLATQVIVRVQDYFHIDIALRSVFERPTIAVLAQQIEQQQLGQVDANEMDQLLSELDGLSEAEIADLLT
ncbi:MAG: amino acid adenylation domain-containing protein [Cyanobacteria bacterium J06598_3]